MKNVCIILECFKSTLRTFWGQFQVFAVQNKYFSQIRQICQIHFGKTEKLDSSSGRKVTVISALSVIKYSGNNNKACHTSHYSCINC